MHIHRVTSHGKARPDMPVTEFATAPSFLHFRRLPMSAYYMEKMLPYIVIS